ncbi:MAG: tRNA uridine-5-carboxymethylaminomethyl(34) synthesis GTPase MnmE [Rhodospirillales bacterium]|nr:tRNA uridine-5-carboxymethylaminomethyl(34) synthesis GTPase MnmE [Rhodospirillales bacterium]
MNTATIFALASGLGPAGVSVIRISGPNAPAAAIRLTGRAELPPRRLVRCQIRDVVGDTIDDALVVRFAKPASFTGEDVVELYVHGGRAVVDETMRALAACDGLRPAEPGEFTRRAFDNGKLDLTAVEGLADLVSAETKAQLRQALRQMQGELASLYDGWRSRLLAALAHMEAVIDFSDEDLPAEIEGRVSGEIDALIQEIDHHLNDDRRGERLREGIRVVIVGPPNAGKSTLLNLLARRDAAIVSDTPGTTRDVVEVHMDLAGYPVTVSDTAGLRETKEEVEAEGVRRSMKAASSADVRLVVFDGATWPNVDRETATLINQDAIAIVNKCDLHQVREPLRWNGHGILGVSARNGDGVDRLLEMLQEKIARRFQVGETPVLTRIRHRRALEECHEALQRSRDVEDIELIAEDMRLAIRALGRITGRVDVEDILDVIFRDFCIGK